MLIFSRHPSKDLFIVVALKQGLKEPKMVFDCFMEPGLAPSFLFSCLPGAVCFSIPLCLEISFLPKDIGSCKAHGLLACA